MYTMLTLERFMPSSCENKDGWSLPEQDQNGIAGHEIVAYIRVPRPSTDLKKGCSSWDRKNRDIHGHCCGLIDIHEAFIRGRISHPMAGPPSIRPKLCGCGLLAGKSKSSMLNAGKAATSGLDVRLCLLEADHRCFPQ